MPNDFTLIRSQRKTVSIQILPDQRILVRAPEKMSTERIQEILSRKESWIQASRLRIQELTANASTEKLTFEDIEVLKQQAIADFRLRTENYAKSMGVSFEKISVRCQTSRWGSCSHKGNLSFNCLLMLAPETVRDYVVVHELCHRKYMNHSPAFWATVADVLPDYRQAKNWLKENGYSLIARIK